MGVKGDDREEKVEREREKKERGGERNTSNFFYLFFLTFIFCAVEFPRDPLV